MADISITAASVVPGSNANVENGTAGETITAGQVVYKVAATGYWKKADSNDATAEVRQAKGIALNGGAVGQPVRVLKDGDITIGATLTAGLAYYLSDTPGGICPVADIGSGEYVCLVGLAKSTTVLAVDIQYPGVFALIMKAGDLRERFAFSVRSTVNDGLGNVQGEWTPQFTVWANKLILKGGETVMANRLSGKAPAVVTIRWSKQVATVTTDWRCTDTRTGDVFNIRSIQPSDKRDFIELLVEKGVAV